MKRRKHTDRDLIPMSPRNMRIDAGLTQREVAERMGVRNTDVLHLERRYRDADHVKIVGFLRAVDRAGLADRIERAVAKLTDTGCGTLSASTLHTHFHETGQTDLKQLMAAVSRKLLSTTPACEPDRLSQPEQVKDETAVLRRTAVAEFLAERCELHGAVTGQQVPEDRCTPARTLAYAYDGWCRENGRSYPGILASTRVFRQTPGVVEVKNPSRTRCLNITVRPQV